MGYDSVGKEEFRALVKRVDTLEGRVQVLEDKLAEVKKPFLAEINRPGVQPVVALVAEEAPEPVSVAVVEPQKTGGRFLDRWKKRDVEPVQAEEKEPR